MTCVITGSAMTTSVGADKAACFEGLCSGRSGRKALQSFTSTHFNVQHAYEIADRPDGIDRPLRASSLLCKAIASAVHEARLPENSRAVIVVGTGLRELRSLELFWTDGLPMSIDQLHFEAAVQQHLGVDYPVVTLANACSASNFALAVAEDFLRDGAFDYAIVGGCDTVTKSMFGLLDHVNPVRPDAVRPFDRDRQGVLMGDGAAAVVLERQDGALARGAKVLATLRGVGTSCDAWHETAPDAAGIMRAMQDAYQRAAVSPHDIDIVMAHGTGTQLNDKAEAVAMQQVMQEMASHPRISAIKSMTGHTSGASGLVGVVTAIEALDSGLLPPTIGLEHLMPEARSMNIVNESVPINAELAQVNAFGFGGVNAVAILERGS
ncbi:beta-ketoacyl synthase N-terminal-like domain-containing protein [Cupriavidus sp. BIS7]|uniref:beta-ketoacyl-[acyl-carrier-protein] synthase family protein n=1 Tax=Cupriavidus sp. BIS7 TaxID=1217718 RepID=UPI0002E1168A|nr:beta-ketoacyl synthase N-terminal-like domain-containing protein [Cupriavidus sp. BIS7]